MTLASRIEKLEQASGEVDVVTIDRLIVTAKDGKPDPEVPTRVVKRPYPEVQKEDAR